MNIQGRLTVKLPEQRGTSKAGKDWVKQDFVIETQETYPKKVCISILGEKLNHLIDNIQEGELITCHINIQSNEYNGKYFTNISAWKIELNERNSSAPPPPAENQNLGQTLPDTDLPF